MYCLGVNLGALTVKVVAVRDDARMARVAADHGRPLEVLKHYMGSITVDWSG